MGVFLKIFAFLGSALGLIAWLGGTALVAYALTQAMGSSPDSATALAKLIVVIAGVVVALVASIVLLRVTRNLIWFFVCFACGAFAALAGAGFNPGSLAGGESLLVVGALGILGVSVVVLAVTKRMVPFLVCLGLLGIVGVVAASVGGVLKHEPELQGPTESAPMPMPPESSGQGAPPPTEILPTQPPATAGEAAAPPPVTDGIQSPDKSAATGGDLETGAAAGRADVEEQARTEVERRAQETEAAVAPRPRIGATRSLRPPSSGSQPSPPPPPPPMAAAPEAAEQPPGSGPTAAITAPSEPASAEPTPVIADVKPSDFQTAELKFNKPEQMEIDTPYVIEASISGALAEAEATLGNVGPTVTRQTKITRKVRVELIASDFDIRKLSAVNTVLITPETSGKWAWEVTPRREGGNRILQLQVWGVLERDGVSQGETLIKTYEETIPVKVTPMARVRIVSQGIVDRWQPIAGALGVIGGIWVFLQKVLGALTRRRKVEPV